MPEVRRYAEGTEVSAEKSRAELEALLVKHGASAVQFTVTPERTTIVFQMRGLFVRQRVDYPQRKPLEYIKPYHKRSESQITNMVEAEWRRLWRAQLLIVKSKLEIIASGGSTFEREFLADMLLADGQTVVEVALPRIMESYQTGLMPALLLGSGE